MLQAATSSGSAGRRQARCQAHQKECGGSSALLPPWESFLPCHQWDSKRLVTPSKSIAGIISASFQLRLNGRELILGWPVHSAYTVAAPQTPTQSLAVLGTGRRRSLPEEASTVEC